MLQLATIEPFTLGLLKKLMTRPYMEPFFLVGGTALALQMGHRKSIDLKYKHSTLFHVIKSLTYFDDAESDLNPIVLDKKTTWSKVKKTIQKAVIEIYK
jgi:hypothetical protein